VQEWSHEEDGEQREHHLATKQSRARALTPPAQGCAHDDNRRANEGANVDSDALPLFRRASQNLAVVAMLLHGCPEAATSEERRVR
jgi:hypothetical protein